MIRHSLAFAFLVALAAPGAALAADDAEILGDERGISVVPLDRTGTGDEAAEIADLVNGAQTGAGTAGVADEPTADSAEALEAAEPVASDAETAEEGENTGSALAGVESAADLYERLLRAGYDVAVVGRDFFGRYAFLVRKVEASEALILVVDGDTGEVLAHRAVNGAGHGHAENGHAYTGRPATNRNCHGGPSAGYRSGRVYARY